MPFYLVTYRQRDKTAVVNGRWYSLPESLLRKHHCHCPASWPDQKKAMEFYLIRATAKEKVLLLMHEAMMRLPDKVQLVNPSLAQAFKAGVLAGRKDVRFPVGYGNLAKPDLRAFLVVKVTRGRLLCQLVGADVAAAAMLTYRESLSRAFQDFGAIITEKAIEGCTASFSSCNQALDCALDIHDRLKEHAELLNLRIGIHSGRPVEGEEIPYREIMDFAAFFCDIGIARQILISPSVRDAYMVDCRLENPFYGLRLRCLDHSQVAFLQSLRKAIGHNLQNPGLNNSRLGSLLSMSKSQLYRKTKHITGMSPNELLQEYRLNKSLDILEKSSKNISQTTLEIGFSSISYFSKCFKKRFEFTPRDYNRNHVICDPRLI